LVFRKIIDLLQGVMTVHARSGIRS